MKEICLKSTPFSLKFCAGLFDLNEQRIAYPFFSTIFKEILTLYCAN